jgi:starch-binding outer membrane protein, SusD/RagB family
MKRTIIIICLINIIFIVACKKYLDENYLSGENATTAFETEKGFESMVNASYVTLRAFYGKENGWDFTEAGTDLYTYGADNRSIGFCTYKSFVGAQEQVRSRDMWAELYAGVNTCNFILQRVDNLPFKFKNDSTQSYRKGEVLFLRSLYYWLIVETWGGVYFSTEPTTAPSHEVKRTPVDTFYNHIISDLNLAATLLPENTNQYGRITKPAAEAFLARIFLTRGENAKALALATKVINSYSFKLLNKWDDIWSINNMKNDEIVWAVNYSDNPLYTKSGLRYYDTEKKQWVEYDHYTTTDLHGLEQRDGGNHGLFLWEIRYENTGWGMKRDIQNGRGFQRWLPTRFFIELFNEKVDKRFLGSFKTAWYSNFADSFLWEKRKPVKDTVTGKVSIKPKYWWINGVRQEIPRAKEGTPMFNVGDTAIYFSKEPIPATQKARIYDSLNRWYVNPNLNSPYLVFDINDMYDANGNPKSAIDRQFYFPITKKYMDTTLVSFDADHEFSRRDAYVIRISEMYLIAAEAAMKTGNTSDAYNYLKLLAEARAYNGDGAALLSSYGVNSGADISIDFILDERARELASENLRFFDLKRTGKLIERVRAHNNDAAPYIQDYHALRFIPQAQLDAVFNEDFKQNPGY